MAQSTSNTTGEWKQWQNDYSVHLLIALCGSTKWTKMFGRKMFKMKKDYNGNMWCCTMTWAGTEYTGRSTSKNGAENSAALEIVRNAAFGDIELLKEKMATSIFQLANLKFKADLTRIKEISVQDGYKFRYKRLGQSFSAPIDKNKTVALSKLHVMLLAPVWKSLTTLREQGFPIVQEKKFSLPPVYEVNTEMERQNVSKMCSTILEPEKVCVLCVQTVEKLAIAKFAFGDLTCLRHCIHDRPFHAICGMCILGGNLEFGNRREWTPCPFCQKIYAHEPEIEKGIEYGSEFDQSESYYPPECSASQVNTIGWRRGDKTLAECMKLYEKA